MSDSEKSHIFLPGGAGFLEAEYRPHPVYRNRLGLVFHPHPKAGGHMRNAVVRTLFEAGCANNLSMLRINFRGVGRSEGKFSYGEGELADAISVFEWLCRTALNPKEIWVMGFSFGAWIGMQLLMRRPEISNFVMVSPQVTHYDFSFLTPCPMPGIIINGQDDILAPAHESQALSQRLCMMQQSANFVEYAEIAGADYAYSGRLLALQNAVETYIKKTQTSSQKISQKQQAAIHS